MGRPEDVSNEFRVFNAGVRPQDSESKLFPFVENEGKRRRVDNEDLDEKIREMRRKAFEGAATGPDKPQGGEENGENKKSWRGKSKSSRRNSMRRRRGSDRGRKAFGNYYVKR